MSQPLVSNVSDTARWVASYRAQESARGDALFRDPFAERLAGEHGRAIATSTRRHMKNGWPVIVRTKLLDDLVMSSVRDGCDRVVNLAAGLDSRPYRLALPPTLRWVEADLPGMVDEKERFVWGQAPVCELARERVDLADARARGALLDRALDGARAALVITEGLLIYLEEPVVRSLAEDLRARGARWWLMDLCSPAILRMLQGDMKKQLERAPMKFAPPQGAAYFEGMGWTVGDCESMLHQAIRMRRLPWSMRIAGIFPPPDPRRLGPRSRWAGVLRLERRT